MFHNLKVFYLVALELNHLKLSFWSRDFVYTASTALRPEAFDISESHSLLNSIYLHEDSFVPDLGVSKQ